MDVKAEEIIRYGDFQPNWKALVEPLRKGRYTVESTQDRSIHGDAPKSFIRIKEYVPGHANASVRRWPGYIAKVGSKRYPTESITEHLLTRIGQTFGIVIADSKLRIVAGQVRFLSKYFLSPKESLVHGLEIFRRHLDDDMVYEISLAKRERDFYTFQTVVAAIKDIYPDHVDTILRGVVEMLAFDAIAGNNDRHPLNWGVIVPVAKASRIQFAPVFDSARGMFWNLDDSQLPKYVESSVSMDAYARRSRPQIAWDGRHNINHFDLIQAIYADYPEYRGNLTKFSDSRKSVLCAKLVEDEFGSLMSEIRRRAICTCIVSRHERYCAALV